MVCWSQNCWQSVFLTQPCLLMTHTRINSYRGRFRWDKKFLASLFSFFPLLGVWPSNRVSANISRMQCRGQQVVCCVNHIVTTSARPWHSSTYLLCFPVICQGTFKRRKVISSLNLTWWQNCGDSCTKALWLSEVWSFIVVFFFIKSHMLQKGWILMCFSMHLMHLQLTS